MRKFITATMASIALFFTAGCGDKDDCDDTAAEDMEDVDCVDDSGSDDDDSAGDDDDSAEASD